MGHLMIIHGYIKPIYEEAEHNLSALERFPFDENWPLPNIFHYSKVGVHPPIISFAMPYYSSEPDWMEWMPHFERLLGHLRAEEAVVNWESEIRVDAPRYYYYPCRDISAYGSAADGWKPPGNSAWEKIMWFDENGEEKEIEEQLLL